jgi:hypothetical protein
MLVDPPILTGSGTLHDWSRGKAAARRLLDDDFAGSPSRSGICRCRIRRHGAASASALSAATGCEKSNGRQPEAGEYKHHPLRHWNSFPCRWEPLCDTTAGIHRLFLEDASVRCVTLPIPWHPTSFTSAEKEARDLPLMKNRPGPVTPRLAPKREKDRT